MSKIKIKQIQGLDTLTFYIPTSGNTVSKVANAIYATTISATTYQNLPIDIRVTGGTYSDGTATFTNNTGGTFTVSGFSTGSSSFTGGTITGPTTFINGLTANTVSATTYYNLPTDIYVTGGTYSDGTAILRNNTGGTFNITGFFKTSDDVYTTGMTFDTSNYNLTISKNDGTSYTQSLSILASDLTVTGGSYNANSGVATFTNNTGGTFTVSGFLTGQTDTYVTGMTFTNNNLTLKQTNDQADVNVLINTMTGLTINGDLIVNSSSQSIFSGNSSSDLVRITQTGSGNALVVEDTTNPDSSPFIVNASGFVGVGTYNPLSKFVISNNNSEGIEMGYIAGLTSNYLESFNRNTGYGVDMTYYISNTGAHRFYTNSSERVRIDNDGNVGMGTTSPSYKLEVSGTIGVSNNLYWKSGDGVDWYIQGQANGPIIRMKYDSSTPNRNGALGWVDNSNVKSDILTWDNSKSYFNTNVGIGTSNPSYLLDVQKSTGTGNQIVGRFLAGTNTNGSAGGITLGSTQTQTGYIYGEQTASSSGDLVFGVQNLGSYAERMRILANGSVGIGTTTPVTTLDVSGSSRITGGLTASTISATTYYNLPSGSFTGGTVTGATTFTNGLSANTITADTVTTFIPTLASSEIYRGITFRNNSTTIDTYGGIVTSTSASNLAQSVASTTFASKQIRLRYYASVVSTGRYTGVRGQTVLWFIGGGFRYVCDFNISDTAFASTCQQFYGLAGQEVDLAYGGVGLTQVSTLTNLIGVGNDGSDTNLQIIHNDASGTATKIDLGSGFPANRTAGSASTTVYSVTLYNAPSSNNVKYMVVNNETGAVAMGTITTNLPATTQALNFFASRAMGSGGGITNSGQFDLLKLGVYSLL